MYQPACEMMIMIFSLIYFPFRSIFQTSTRAVIIIGWRRRYVMLRIKAAFPRTMTSSMAAFLHCVFPFRPMLHHHKGRWKYLSSRRVFQRPNIIVCRERFCFRSNVHMIQTGSESEEEFFELQLKRLAI